MKERELDSAYPWDRGGYLVRALETQDQEVGISSLLADLSYRELYRGVGLLYPVWLAFSRPSGW